MNNKSITRRECMSMIVAALFTMAFLLSLGAGKSATSNVEVLQQRFLILESTRLQEATNGYQQHVLQVCPHYGKIDQDSLKFRLASETQELRMIVTVAEGHRFERGDIISFGSLHHLRLAAGSRVSRPLPNGGQELVP